MSSKFYMGNNVGGVYQMPMTTNYGYGHSGGKTTEELINDLEKLISSLKYQYLLAVTANKFQKHAMALLRKMGFKDYVTFKSSHANKDEFLSIWVKQNKNFNKSIKDKIEDISYWNCSVNFNLNTDKKCSIVVRKNGENLPEGFKQIKNTPIWYFVRDNDLRENREFFDKLKPVDLFPVLKEKTKKVFGFKKNVKASHAIVGMDDAF